MKFATYMIKTVVKIIKQLSSNPQKLFLIGIRLSKYILYNFLKLLGSNSASLLTG
jgi:hypothetical protein